MTLCLLNVFIGVLAAGCFLPEVISVENLALRQSVRSSYTWYHWRPWKAVDGNRTSTGGGTSNSCARTRRTLNPWWRVDLGALSEVHSVSITNHVECCANLLRNFTIAMSQTLADDTISLRDPSLCFHYHAGQLDLGATVNFPCPGPVYARYVKIQLHLENAQLTLCEVEVFGLRSAPPLHSCPSYTSYTALSGRKSPAMVLLRIPVSFIVDCAFRCKGLKHCYSMNIKQEDDTWICELLEDVRELNGSDVIPESGWTYFRVLK